MAFAVNDLLQVACEDLNLVEDGDPISGDLASKAEGCLNRAITTLNADGYISLTVDTVERTASGSIVFKKLEEGETPSAYVVDSEPPDTVSGVSRKVGIRWMRLRPSNVQAMDRLQTYSYPTTWSYGVSYETAPSGQTRQVGILHLNGSYPSQLRVYINSQLPHYKLGDTIYLSPLYYNIVLYATEDMLVARYHLKSYEERVGRDLLGAKKSINTNTANNRPLDNGLDSDASYLDGYENLIGGVGF